MKAAAFDYARARSTAHAVELLAEHPEGRLIAGGQSLGPMLNLRLARPGRLIDIRECAELRRYMESSDEVVWGAAITHGEIEDGDVPDPSPGWLRQAARNIAYRAIRNQGTIGGSLAHADPAADWPVVLAALGAEVWIEGPAGARAEALHAFLRGPFATSLAPGEILTAVRVPRPSPAARFGYCKLAAKRGEFAQALAVVFEDPERDATRAVVGAIERVPLVVESATPFSGEVADARALLAARLPSGSGGPLHAAALARAARAVRGPDATGGRPSPVRPASTPAGDQTGRGNGEDREGGVTNRERGAAPDPGPMPSDSVRPRARLTVNGRPVEAEVEPRTHLADFLRERLHLTGTHLGCEHGVCGACTVLIDGVPARSCIAFAAACDGADVRTIEGFAGDPLMNALRGAFTRRHALQCGYCTPGMLVSAWDIARRMPDAGESRIRDELAGNLCRCTGYQGIVEAVADVLADSARTAPTLPFVRRAPAAARMERPAPGPGETDSAPARPGPGARTARAASAKPSDAIDGTRALESGTGPTAASTDLAGPSGQLLPKSSGVADASTISWRTEVSASPDTLWATLRDVPRMVAALPGAELAGPPEERPLRLRLVAAIGPMRASFAGQAEVTFDDEARSGGIEGRAHDPASRSTSEGRVRFQVTGTPAGGAELDLAIRYRIRGPLAQFSRGPVVDAVIEQLLARFAENLGAAAAGEAIPRAPPPGGVWLLLTGLGSLLRRWFTR